MATGEAQNRSMLKCSTSLWSADLADLAAEIRRVGPYSERFHLDVADGHYSSTLLFFPDLVKAIRPHTRLEFEVHLMTTDPGAWIAPFAEAGADSLIFCWNSAADPGAIVEAVVAGGMKVGVSLEIREDIDLLAPLWERLQVVTLMATEIGIKGAEMDPSIPAKVQRLFQLRTDRQLAFDIEVDGGIRRHTVPQVAAAGADYIVPGSLMFNEDPAAMRRWLVSLDRPRP